MIGTIAMYTSGHPWPGGAIVRFEQCEALAVGVLHSYNDFVRRYLVRFADGREAFVKIGEQPEADRRWLSGIGRELRRELRAQAIEGTLAIPTRDLSFVVHWRDVPAARMRDVPKSSKQLDGEIADALKRQSKSALMAEYRALKRSLADASLSDADIQTLRSKLAKIDTELVARNTAEYIEFEKRPRKGGY